MQLSITTNFADVQRKLDTLRSDMRDTVLVRTLNRTIEGARTDMSKEIRKEFNVTATFVRERLKIRRAFARGRLSLEAVLSGGDGKRRSANVIAFMTKAGIIGATGAGRRGVARSQSRSVKVKIKKAGGFKPIKGAFVGNKGRTVFRRTGDARLPIEPVRTIDVAQMFNTRRVNAAVVRAIEIKLPGIFEREARYALSRFRR